MKVFICSRKADERRTRHVVEQLRAASKNEIAVLQHTEHSEKWRIAAERKIRECDFVMFIVEEGTFDGEGITWEYEKAKSLHKRIIGFRSELTPLEMLLFCEGFQVFDDPGECASYLSKTFDSDRQLLIEQFKIMVASTEKVTGQRLTVNNLFFTVTSSVVSIALVVGKTLDFSIIAVLGMIVFTILGLLLTFFWKSLVTAYGLLNRGKFVLIGEIEKRLRTNMFDREWKILTQDLKYQPNTKTERTIVSWYQCFIAVMLATEIFYLIWLICGKVWR